MGDGLCTTGVLTVSCVPEEGSALVTSLEGAAPMTGHSAQDHPERCSHLVLSWKPGF